MSLFKNRPPTENLGFRVSMTGIMSLLVVCIFGAVGQVRGQSVDGIPRGLQRPSPTPQKSPQAKKQTTKTKKKAETRVKPRAKSKIKAKNEKETKPKLSGKALQQALKQAEIDKTDPRAKEPIPVVPPPDESLGQRMLRKNHEWSKMFDGMAEGIDVYLIGRKVTERKNETSITIENSTDIVERKGAHNSWNLNADIRLPNVEDYWQLKFTSYDEQEDRRGVKRGTYRQAERPQNYGASVGLTQSIGPIKTQFQPRVELKNPLRVAHSLRFETVADMITTQIHPTLEFFANPEKGTGIFAALNFNFIFNPTYSVLWINDGDYEENRNLLTANNGLSLLQIVDDASSFSYSLYLNSNSRPNYHLNSYTFSAAWSHSIYRNILEYQIIPHLDFYTSHFAGVPGLLITINLKF